MEKESGSGYKQSIDLSSVAASTQKQKSSTTIDINVQPTKIRKITEQNYPDQSSSQNQCLSTQLITEDPLANYDDSERPKGIWNDVNLSQLSLNNNQKLTQSKEMEDRLAQADLDIKNLKKAVQKVEKNNQSMTKYLEGENKTIDEMIEQQNISGKFLSLAREQVSVITDMLKGLEESKEQLSEMYNNVISKQEETSNLKKEFNAQVLREGKILAEQLKLKSDELFITQTKVEQFENDALKMDQIIYELDVDREEYEKIIHEDSQRHKEETQKMLDTIKYMKENLNRKREEKSKLLAESKENSNRYHELLSEYQTLKDLSIGNENTIKCLESNIQELKEKEENLKHQVHELNSKHLETKSESDLEFIQLRKQLQDLLLMSTETTNKLSEINSDNEKLSDTVAKTAQGNEELEAMLGNKDEEIIKLSNDLRNILATNKELSVKAQSLNEELVEQKKMISDAKTSFQTYDAKEDENAKSLFEMRTKLMLLKQKFKNTCDDVAKHYNEVNDDKIRSSEQMNNFKLDIELRNKQLADLEKTKENRQREKERLESEYNKELRQVTQSWKQCEKVGHERQIKEQNMKIDILREEIAAEKHNHKLENLKKNETDSREKEKRENQLKELKTNITDFETRICESNENLQDLRRKLKKAQTLNDVKSPMVTGSLNSSRLSGIIFGNSKLTPTASTPQQSPVQGARVRFDFGSSSDLSSINGSDMFEQVDRQYAEFLRSNKTDNAKLNEPHGADKL